MNTQRRRNRSGNRMIAIAATVLVHGLIIGALFFNFTKKPTPTVDAQFSEKVDVVKATTVDAADIKKELEKIKKNELEKKRQQQLEKKRLKELKRQSEQEKKKIEELKQARKEIALKKKKEQDKRKKEEAEHARQKKLKKKMELEEAQRQLQEQIAAEEAFQADKKAKERAAELVGKYVGDVVLKVTRFWNITPGLSLDLKTKINVKLSPLGDILSVSIVESSGDLRFDRQVESAVLKSTPLPVPPVTGDSEVDANLVNLNINFKLGDLQ